MAFPFDSLCALALWGAAMWNWRTARSFRVSARITLRFAAVLLAAQAASLVMPAPALAFNVALIAGSVAGTALALGYSSPRGTPPWLCGLALVLALAAGLTASLAAVPLVGFGCEAGAAAYIFAASLWRFREYAGSAATMAGSFALFLSGLALMGGGAAQAMLLFASALSLVVRALEKPVANADARIELSVGRKRA
jgi:hypothetical protein